MKMKVGIGGWLYYLGVQKKKIPKEKFWKMTPRKLCILADLHYKYTQQTKEGVKDEDNSLGYIDEIFN